MVVSKMENIGFFLVLKVWILKKKQMNYVQIEFFKF
jgi:hypothetical protein